MAGITAGLLYASLALSAASAGYSAYSANQQGKAQQALNNYNAAASDQAALDAQRDARIKANTQRAENDRIKARQRTLYAKAGVVSGTGSPLMVQVQQAGELEMAALEQEQIGNADAAKLRTQAVIDRMAGRSARSAGRMNAFATVLQGAGQMASTGLSYNMYRGAR
jgi:hypothetical protein